MSSISCNKVTFQVFNIPSQLSNVSFVSAVAEFQKGDRRPAAGRESLISLFVLWFFVVLVGEGGRFLSVNLSFRCIYWLKILS